MKKILVINPGSTSTKFAVYHDEEAVFTKTLRHQGEELAPYPNVASQYEFRKETILNALKEEGIAIDFDIIECSIMSPSLNPRRSSVFAMRSEPKRRMRLSSSDTKNTDEPGSP